MRHQEIPAYGPSETVRITAAYQEVREYNRKYTGIGALLARSVVAVMAQSRDGLEAGEPAAAKPSAAEEFGERIERFKVEGGMFGELRLLVHGELFERVGLKLVQHPDGQTVLLQCLNGHQQPEGVELATAKKITPMVRSSELFVDFLTGFHPEVANRDAELLDLLTDVLQGLRWAVIVGQDRPPATATAAEIQLLAEFGEDNLRHFVTIDGALQALDLRRPALYEECLAAGPDDRRRQAWRRQAAAYLTVYGELEDYIRYHGRGLLAERFLVGSDADLRDSRRLRIYFDNQTHLLAEKVDLIVGFKDDERTCLYGAESAEALLASLRQALKDIYDQPDLWYATEPNRRLLAASIGRLSAAYGLK